MSETRTLIKAVRTGNRIFATKADESEKVVMVDGVRGKLLSCDTWSSGEHPGDGEYIRVTYLCFPLVDPWPNLKMVKAGAA